MVVLLLLFSYVKSQVEICNRLGTGPVPQKDLQYWCGTGINTAYHRRGSEMKSVLVQYQHYSAVGCQPTLGLRTIFQYRANLRPAPTVQYRHCFLFTNWRGTVPFVNTGMNPTSPPGIEQNQHLFTKKQFRISNNNNCSFLKMLLLILFISQHPRKFSLISSEYLTKK